MIKETLKSIPLKKSALLQQGNKEASDKSGLAPVVSISTLRKDF